MKIRIITVVVLIAVVVMGLYFYKHYENQKKLATKPPATPTVVEFAQAKQVDWYDQVEAIGTAFARRGVDLRAEVAGRVTDIMAPSGTIVTKGTPLYQINPKVLQAQLDEDQATLVLAQFNFDQIKKIYKQRLVSLEEFKQAQAALGLSKAKVANSQEQLGLATVVAPFDGIVGLKEVDIGDYVEVGQVLATFQSSKQMRVEFTLPEQYATQIRVGNKVIITRELPTAKTYQGVIYAFNPLINQDTRMLEVRADIDNGGLLPGMYVNVIVRLGEPQPVVVVPETAVMMSLHGDSVYRVVDGKAIATLVKLGQHRGDVIAITQGLKAGDEIVSAGQLKIHSGDAVTDKGAFVVKPKLGS